LSISWHPKGPVLAVGGKDFMVWMFNAKTGQLLQSFAGHEDIVTHVRFSFDGTLLLSASEDKSVKVW
jgi:WD40 repeat protein